MIYQTEAAYKQAVLRARNMTFEEKFLEGERLFEEVCEQMRQEIRKEMPGSCEELVEMELHARLERQREEEDRGIHIKMPVGWQPPQMRS